jgi:glutamyl-tRNA synthetase
VSFEDLVHGNCTQDVDAEVGAFVVRRNDGVASYQLAVVVDDAASDVTDVLRGDDLLSSTARQLQLYRALGLNAPRFAHVPLLVGPDGKRLAKREGGWTVAQLREQKVAPERVIGLLAKWSGLGDGAPISARELVDGFKLAQVPREPVRVKEEPRFD